MKNLENAKELNELEVKVVAGGRHGDLQPYHPKIDIPYEVTENDILIINNGGDAPRDGGATGGW